MLGLDIVEVSRIAKLAVIPEFVAKVYTDGEIESLKSKSMTSWAGVWAAKEAVAKALGTGFSNGIMFRDINVFWNNYGKPCAELQKAALKRLYECGFGGVELSISHTDSYAVAVCLLVK